MKDKSIMRDTMRIAYCTQHQILIWKSERKRSLGRL